MADAAPAVPGAYVQTGGVSPDWLNKGDNAWQLTASTLVGIQSVPALVILYGSIVKKKWAVNSAFMAFYAFAAVLLCWVGWAYKMSFGEKLLPLWGKAGTTLSYKYLLSQAVLPSTAHYHANGELEVGNVTPFFPMATLVYFQFVFAAITVVLLAGSVLGRMSFRAWMLFVPLWLTCSYTVGAFSLWGGGFLWQWGVIDYAGGYVIHLSSGVGGFTAAYWVDKGPGALPSQQRAADAGRSGFAVDGMGGLQRWCRHGCQFNRFHRRHEHQCVRLDQPAGVDVLGRASFRKAVCDWRCAGNDYRPGRHHPRCRSGARVGGARDGHLRRVGSVVHDDGGAQELQHSAEGGRHAGRVPHARRGGPGGRASRGLLRGAPAVQLLPGRDERAGGVLWRRGRQAAGQADDGRALHHRVERGDDQHHPERHPPGDAPAHDGRTPAGRRRRRARRGSVRALGRRREVRHLQARRRLRSGHHPPRLRRRRQATPHSLSLNPVRFLPQFNPVL